MSLSTFGVDRVTPPRISATMFCSGWFRLSPRRYLCSQLVTLRCGLREFTVNLEEIWESGAILECDEGPPTGIQVELRCGDAHLFGQFSKAEPHAFGWRAEMEFSPLTPWSAERFEPAHMLDPSELGQR